MRRITFLGVTPPEEAWKTVLQVLKSSGFNVRASARRLRVSHAHLYQWLSDHPSIKTRFLKARLQFVREQLDEGT